MILLGLGSNMGNRRKNILEAVRRLKKTQGIRVRKMSSLYETEPYGFKEQAMFLNAVVWIETEIEPEHLLAVCLAIETSMGRERGRRWGPRSIDIDLLIYHNRNLETKCLRLPHPYLALRRFVLIPMEEITRDLPVVGMLSARDLILHCPDQGKVRLAGNPGNT